MDAIQDGQRQLDLAKFPLWTGNRDKDLFTAEQWIARVDGARRDGGWNDQRVMTHVLVSLRGDALLWFESLRRCEIDTTNFETFKRAFLTTYSEAKTARSVKLNLSDLSQKPNESVKQYHPRLVKILDDVEHFWPEQFATPRGFEATIPADIRALAGWEAAGLNEAKNQLYQALMRAGAQQGLNSLGLLIFKAGLPTRLSDELMKTAPARLWDAFEEAQSLEVLWNINSKKVVNAVNLAASGSDEPEVVEDEIAALTAQLDALKKRKYFAQKGAQGGSYGNNKGNGKNPKWKDIQCHYCHKKGHPQRVCFKRKRENGALVDWKTVKAIEEDDNDDEYQELGAVEAVHQRGEPAFEQAFRAGKAALN